MLIGCVQQGGTRTTMGLLRRKINIDPGFVSVVGIVIDGVPSYGLQTHVSRIVGPGHGNL